MSEHISRIAPGAGDPGGAPRRVLIVGGRQLGRDALRALLSRGPDIEVVGTCSDQVSARSAVQVHDVDVVVAHVYLGEVGGGARLAVHLRDAAPEVGVVLLLGESDPREVRQVLDGGTPGRALLLLDHPRCATDLVRAIEEVAAGGSFVHTGVVDLLLRAESQHADTEVRLTQRERQVLTGIAAGASNRRIASMIGASERAVEKHINQLYAKLEIPNVEGVHRRVLAARRALGLPLIADAEVVATPPEVVPPPLAVS